MMGGRRVRVCTFPTPLPSELVEYRQACECKNSMDARRECRASRNEKCFEGAHWEGAGRFTASDGLRAVRQLRTDERTRRHMGLTCILAISHDEQFVQMGRRRT